MVNVNKKHTCFLFCVCMCVSVQCVFQQVSECHQFFLRSATSLRSRFKEHTREQVVSTRMDHSFWRYIHDWEDFHLITTWKHPHKKTPPNQNVVGFHRTRLSFILEIVSRFNHLASSKILKSWNHPSTYLSTPLVTTDCDDIIRHLTWNMPREPLGRLHHHETP